MSDPIVAHMPRNRSNTGGSSTALAASLAHVVRQARTAGLSSLDLWTLEALLREEHEHRDLLPRCDLLPLD